MSFLEARPLQGGGADTFFNTTLKFREQALLYTSPVDLQLLIDGLCIGSLIHVERDSARTGGSKPFSYNPYPCSYLVEMPAGPRYTRAESISRHMSRLLLHGPNAREPVLNLNHQDGGSIMVQDLLKYSTFARTHVAQAEIMTAAQARDSKDKLRFDLSATLQGPKVRCFQCHSLVVNRPHEPQQADHDRYLIHATAPESASSILREGMKQPQGRREFHFAELNYNERQAQYIVNSKHNKRAWLVLDTALAKGLNYSFSKISNDVIVSPGANAHIHRTAFVSAWLPDAQKISISELLAAHSNLVTIDHDNSHPPPHRIEEAVSETIRKRSRTPARSPNRLPSPAQDYSPASPTPSQLDLPGNERPSPWTPPGENTPKRSKAASVSSVSVSNVASPLITHANSHEITHRNSPALTATPENTSVHSEPIFSPEGFHQHALPTPPTLTPAPVLVLFKIK